MVMKMDSKERILKIYFKNHRRPFVEIEGVKESHFDDLLMNLNTPNLKYIKIAGLIFDKEKFDHAELE